MPENVISLETAQGWASNYNCNREILSNFKAIKVPGSNMTNIMESGAVDVRCYFGINDLGEPVLMVVGTDEKGDDMIDEDNGLFIYDMSHPCPTCCNTQGPFINKP